MRGISNDDGAVKFRLLTDLPGHFPAVQLRHGQIQKKKVRFLSQSLFERFLPIGRHTYGIASAFQHFLHDGAIVEVGIGDQTSGMHYRTTAWIAFNLSLRSERIS